MVESFKRARFVRRNGEWFMLTGDRPKPRPRRRRPHANGKDPATRAAVAPPAEPPPPGEAKPETSAAPIVLPATVSPSFDPQTSTWFVEGTELEAPTLPELRNKLPPGTALRTAA